MEIQNIIQSLTPWFLSNGIKIIAILIAASLLNCLARIFTEKIVRGAIKDASEEGEKKRENTLIRIFSSTTSLTIWLMAVLTILPEFGVNITPILAGAGLLGLAVGMGSKDIIGDFLSGIFIILEDRYRVGDSVKIAGVEGIVKDINLRRTILKDSEGIEYSVPNGQVKITANKSRTA